MTRHHSDKPIRPIAALPPPAPIAAIDRFRSSAVTRAAFAQAQAFYRRKLRQRAKQLKTDDSP